MPDRRHVAYAALRTQSLARPLTSAEAALASSLEAIFGTGMHDFGAVATELQQRGVARPSGSVEAWTARGLESELAALNASLDASYARDGIGA